MDKPTRRIFAASILGLSLLAGAQPARTEQVSKWEWKGIDRIVAIGDLHGSYDELVSLLRGTELVNEGLSWTAGWPIWC